MLDWHLCVYIYIYIHNVSMKNTRNSFFKFSLLVLYMVLELGFEFALEKETFFKGIFGITREEEELWGVSLKH